jgi:hypothetical protein
MAEIYSDLSSPEVTIPSDPQLGHIARSILSDEGPHGLLSELYPYQRRSVLAMLQRELPKRRVGLYENDHFVDIADPLYISIVGVNEQEYYLQPAKMTILRERPKVTATRGGILCEELGEYSQRDSASTQVVFKGLARPS